MSNNTFEDYKKAIKAKYEVEINGEYSTNLSSPTPAKLKKLCIKRFRSNNNKDDLNAFESFFDFPFDKDKKNLFGDDELNKLESVKRFLLGVTERPAEDTIQLAAILVDLQPRPFREFRKKIDEEDIELFNELTNTDVPSKIVSSDNLIDGVKIENVSRESFNSEGLEQNDSKNSESNQEEKIKESVSILTLVNNVEKSPNKIIRNLVLVTILIGLCIGLSLAMRKTDCMVWVVDHYEEKSKSDEGYCDSYYDARYFDLKKITVCDTTTFFDNNGRAKVWYFKVSPNSIECFDRYAPYPLNTNRHLKPITQHMIDTYLSDLPKCK